MRAAVIGTNWGQVHKSALAAAGVDVVAMVGREDDLARLGDLNLDLITVATPPATHAKVINALPDVPVLCEKPAVGLGDAGALDSTRDAPIWVNYAFGFLDVAQRAEAALPNLGDLQRVEVCSQVDLASERIGPDLFSEVATHPWSWVITLLGSPDVESARCVRSADAFTLNTSSDTLDVAIVCREQPGLAGISHEVLFHGSHARMRVGGSFAVGSHWVFAAPTVEWPDGSVDVLGSPETGPPDPWYRANARSVAAFVAAVSGAPGDSMLFGWSVALGLDRTLQRALAVG